MPGTGAPGQDSPPLLWLWGFFPGLKWPLEISLVSLSPGWFPRMPFPEVPKRGDPLPNLGRAEEPSCFSKAPWGPCGPSFHEPHRGESGCSSSSSAASPEITHPLSFVRSLAKWLASTWSGAPCSAPLEGNHGSRLFNWLFGATSSSWTCCSCSSRGNGRHRLPSAASSRLSWPTQPL